MICFLEFLQKLIFLINFIRSFFKKILKATYYIIMPILNRYVLRRLEIKVVPYYVLPVSEGLFRKQVFLLN